MKELNSLKKGAIQKVLCRSKDQNGDMCILQVKNNSLGLVRLRVYTTQFPVVLLPYMKGIKVSFIWDRQEKLGSMISFEHQNDMTTAMASSLAFNLIPKEKYENIPYLSDPYSRAITKSHIKERRMKKLKEKNEPHLRIVEKNRLTKEIRSQKNLFNRNIGPYTPKDLLMMKDSEIYKLVKVELLHLRRGIRKSNPREVQYLKDLLEYFKKNE